MFDINAIVNAAINAAVAEATRPLLERIETMEKTMVESTAALAVRCTALEGVDHERSHALEKTLDDTIGELDTLKQRVKALEAKPANATPENISCDAFVVYLDNQEWFWEKLTRKAKEVADAAAEEAIEDHCSSYDHDDYDRTSSAVDDLDLVSRDGLRDTVRDLLNDATISVSF